MNRRSWKNLHRWIGLPICLILAIFSLSGIILNHRSWWASTDISRSFLPEKFSYRQWNQGLLRGTMPYGEGLLLFGSGGIYRTDSLGRELSDFNQGLPKGSDYRQVRAVAALGNRLYMATQMGIYSRQAGKNWQEELGGEERFSDLLQVGDTLYALSRSHLYRSTGKGYWQQIELPKAEGDEGKSSLFRFFWLLHTGELFGWGGQLVVDAIALVLLVLSVTGIFVFLFPHLLRQIKAPRWRKRMGQQLRLHTHWHDHLGRTTLILLLLVVVSGWLLRPPFLIFLAKGQIPALPGTSLSKENPWHDRLRMLRYDELEGDWLLSTSSGFYRLKNWHTAPTPVRNAPPVSPMGVNVWVRGEQGEWLVGSFNGLYAWQRTPGSVIDAFSGQAISHTGGPPFGRVAVAGCSQDLPSAHKSLPLIVTYHGGTSEVPQPQELSQLPMSLWNIALEMHTGRFFSFLPAPDLWWVFLTGILSLLTLLSGWKLRRRKRK